VRFEVFTAVRMTFVFWVLAPCRLISNVKISEKHTVSIFRAEVVMLGSGEIYIGLEELPTSALKMEEYVSPKCWHLLASLHDAKARKNIIKSSCF
jgi:hypothetical protein